MVLDINGKLEKNMETFDAIEKNIKSEIEKMY